MKQNKAPNKRLEPVCQNFSQELRGKDNQEKLFELLQLLGMSLQDDYGSATFKKDRLVTKSMLRFYINAALRYN